MKKITKIILVSIIGLAAVCTISLIVAGNYMLNYSIKRGDGGDDREVSLETAVEVSSDVEQIIDINYARQTEAGKLWHESTSYDTASIISEDNLKLYGELYPAKETTDKYVIVIHGYGDTHEVMYDFAMDYWNEGFNVLMVDLRAHGNSEGTYRGMGWLDRKDIQLWIDMLIGRDSDAQIVLHGVSMGAATVMMTSGEELPDNVKVCIEDCGYSSVSEIFASELKLRFNLPDFPLINITSKLAELRAGYSFIKASSVNQVAKSVTPTLFIHGTADDFVPFEMLQKVYEAASCEKDIFVVEGAKHVESKYVDVDKYNDKVFGFISKYIQ